MRVSGANQAVWRTGWRLDEGLGSKSGGLAHGRRLDEGLGSKSGGLAHGRRLFERYGLHYMLLGVWQAKNVSAEK